MTAAPRVGRGAAHSSRSSASTAGSLTPGPRPCRCLLATARRAPNDSGASPGGGGSMVVVVVCGVVVMEDRYDRPTTTSSIRRRVELLYADLSTGRAARTAFAAGQPTGVPNRHPRERAAQRGKHRRRRAKPQVARWGQIGATVTGPENFRGRGRCGKISHTVSPVATVMASCRNRHTPHPNAAGAADSTAPGPPRRNEARSGRHMPVTTRELN